MTKIRNRLRPALREHRAALIVLALLLLFRLLVLCSLGFSYSLESDDVSYVNSGVTLARTGVLTMHNEYPSAQIMPGLSALIALFSLVFGAGRPLWIALKLFWVCMGTLCAWFVYRAVRLFAPKWCGICAMLPFFRPDLLWMDNLILTETPFHLALTAMVYYALRMGRSGAAEPASLKKAGFFAQPRDFWLCLGAYLCALLLKANIAPFPLLILAYLLVKKVDRKRLARQCVILTLGVLCFLVPWTVRNYLQFHAFIPLTYGSGNPTLLGTYQGTGYPADEDLDYETNVDQVVLRDYARYYREDGTVMPQYARYVGLARDGVKARYRQREWARTNLKQMLYSYLVSKPQAMVNGVFYWDTVLGEEQSWLDLAHRADLFLCIAALAASLLVKKYRREMAFLTAAYLGNIYIYAMTYSFSRYAASLLSLRFLIAGIGLGLLIQLLARALRQAKTQKAR